VPSPTCEFAYLERDLERNILRKSIQPSVEVIHPMHIGVILKIKALGFLYSEKFN